MREHPTNRLLMSSRKAPLSRDCQRLADFYAHKAEKAKKSPKPYPGLRYNHFLASDTEASAWTAIPPTSVARIRQEFIRLRWLKASRVPHTSAVVYRWTHPTRWKKSNGNGFLQKYESKLTKTLKKSIHFRRIPSLKERKEEKGKGNGGDSPRPSRLPLRTESQPTHPLPSFSYTSRKHPLWFADLAGLHCVVPGATRDRSPVLYTHEAFETFLGDLVGYSRGTWNLPRLDRKVLTEKGHKARKMVLKYAATTYRNATGTHEERMKLVEASAKKAILGAYQDQVERRRKGLLAGWYPELADVFSPLSEAHMERRGWCEDRGRQTVNESWQTRDRLKAETEKRRALDRAQAEAMKKSDPARVTSIQGLVRDMLAGRISKADYAARVAALEAACATS